MCFSLLKTYCSGGEYTVNSEVVCSGFEPQQFLKEKDLN